MRACLLGRRISESSKGVGPGNAAVTGRAIQPGGRFRSAAAAAASSRNGAAVVGRWWPRWDEGVQEKPRCDRSSNNSRLSWMGGIFEEGGAVRCSRKVLATVAGCTRPREGRGRTIGPSCTSAQASLHDLQLRAWRETPRS